MSEHREWVRYCFCHSNIKFMSFCHHVMFFLLYRNADEGVFDDFLKISKGFQRLLGKTQRCFDYTPTNLSAVKGAKMISKLISRKWMKLTFWRVIESLSIFYHSGSVRTYSDISEFATFSFRIQKFPRPQVAYSNRISLSTRIRWYPDSL